MTMKDSNSYNTPKDFFIYLLSIITLYAFFASFLALSFKFINLLFPVYGKYNDTVSMDSIRWHIAFIIINFPVYIYTLISIRQSYLRFPEKRNLKIRRWLLYFTLFLAALIIMCDLGTLLYYFLSGDITNRFLIKTLMIVIFVGTLFYFYLKELHQGWTTGQTRLWLWGVLVVVLATLLYGFYVIGSPRFARAEFLDNKRISDLSSIQTNLLIYWKTKKQLPASLTQLNDVFTGYKVPTDPLSHTSYGYQVLSKNSFQLCAYFGLSSEQTSGPAYGSNDNQNWNWQHPQGFYCFQRNVDPSRTQ